MKHQEIKEKNHLSIVSDDEKVTIWNDKISTSEIKNRINEFENKKAEGIEWIKLKKKTEKKLKTVNK